MDHKISVHQKAVMVGTVVRKVLHIKQCIVNMVVQLIPEIVKEHATLMNGNHNLKMYVTLIKIHVWQKVLLMEKVMWYVDQQSYTGIAAVELIGNVFVEMEIGEG